MFTGLIESVAVVASVREAGEGRELRVTWPLAGELSPGESVAVNGVCLTAVRLDAAGFGVDVSPETARVTTLGTLPAGHRVNLERAMRADGRFGGHVVQGHVDGVGVVADLRRDGDGAWFDVDVPPDLAAQSVPRGSVTIDGVSLTIASLRGRRIGIQLVPFTLAHTTLGSLAAGDMVNVETDVIGKYVARWLAQQREGQESIR